MAFSNPFVVAEYNNGLGSPSVLIISNGGVVTKTISQLSRSNNTGDTYCRQVFTWGGNAYIPMGWAALVSGGYIAYNPESDQFEQVFNQTWGAGVAFFPFGKYLVRHTAGNIWQRCTYPEYGDIVLGSGSMSTPNEDYIILGNDLFLLRTGTGTSKVSFPFTGASSTNAVNLTRLAIFKGEIYGIYTTTTTSFLRKWNGATWVDIGSGFGLPESSNVEDDPTQSSFFEFNGKLWLAVIYDTGGTNGLRLFEMDVVLGTATDRTTNLPTSFKAAAPDNFSRIFEIIDDTGPLREVILVKCGGRPPIGGAGAWEAAGFVDGAFTVDRSGAESLFPYSGAIWNKDGKGAHIKDAVDSSPSSFVDMDIAVSDLSLNASVAIDPRYKDLDDAASLPPFETCSELLGQGSEGKTGLSSKPSGITTIANLSDDFADSALDLERWQPINIATNPASWDYGSLASTPPAWHDLQEVAGSPGYLRLGAIAPASVFGGIEGIGVKSKWYIGAGAFQVDVKLTNLANLLLNASRLHSLFFWVKEHTNKGAFFRIFRTGAGAGGLFVRGGYANDEVNIVETIDSTANIADATVLRIARSGANAWTLTLDPTGSPEDKTPGGIPTFSGSVQIFLGAVPLNSSTWISADPGPGFYDLDVSGAASLGKYVGEIEHIFHWDHLLDLGADINKAFELYVDTD